MAKKKKKKKSTVKRTESTTGSKSSSSSSLSGRERTKNASRGKKKEPINNAEVDSSTARKPSGRPSSLLDTRVIYCGDCLEQLQKLPADCIDLIYIDPPFNSNRNYEVFWGETKEKRAFEDRHASTKAYIDYMRPRCVELVRVLKKTGSFYYRRNWHGMNYITVMMACFKHRTLIGIDLQGDRYAFQRRRFSGQVCIRRHTSERAA